MTELSLYEQVSDLSTIKKQWFVELFQGDALDTDRWQTTDIAGTGTFAMVDAINGGFSIITSASSNDRSRINFNDKRQYDHQNSVIIGSTKNIQSTSIKTLFGFAGDITHTADFAFVEGDPDESSGNFGLLTKDATTSSKTGSTTAVDTDWHIHKIQCSSTDIQLTIDDLLEVTKTTNRPSAKLQPTYQAQTTTTATREGRINYMECYNV